MCLHTPLFAPQHVQLHLLFIDITVYVSFLLDDKTDHSFLFFAASLIKGTQRDCTSCTVVFLSAFSQYSPATINIPFIVVTRTGQYRVFIVFFIILEI